MSFDWFVDFLKKICCFLELDTFILINISSDSGLAFIGNNVLGAFDYIKGWLPSFGKGEVVWNDIVIPKLTHLYIPSIYETVQV